MNVINDWDFKEFCLAFGEALDNKEYMKKYPDFHEALGKYDLKYILTCILKREKDEQECFYKFVDTFLLHRKYIKQLYGVILEISKYFMDNGSDYYGMDYKTFNELFEKLVFTNYTPVYTRDVKKELEFENIYL